jgi:ATP-binding cassette subfamily C (CFTR/MRP) protein 2
MIICRCVLIVGFAGLALTYALSLTGLQVFFVQWQCKLVNYIVSVERVSQYMHLPAEGPPVIEGNRPPGDWPSRGEVVLENLKVGSKREEITDLGSRFAS